MKKSASYICISTIILCIIYFWSAGIQATPILPHMFSFDDLEGIIEGRKTHHVQDGPCAGDYCIYNTNMTEAAFRMLWRMALEREEFTLLITRPEYQVPEAPFPKGRTFAISTTKPPAIGETVSPHQPPVTYNIVHVPEEVVFDEKEKLTWEILEQYAVLTGIIIGFEKSPMAQYRGRQQALATSSPQPPPSSPVSPPPPRTLNRSTHPFDQKVLWDLLNAPPTPEREASPISPAPPMQPATLLSQGLLPDRLDVAALLDLLDVGPRDITTGDNQGRRFTISSDMDLASFRMMIELREGDADVGFGSILGVGSALLAVAEYLDTETISPEWSTQYRLYYPFPGYLTLEDLTWEGLHGHEFMTLEFTRKLLAEETAV